MGANTTHRNLHTIALYLELHNFGVISIDPTRSIWKSWHCNKICWAICTQNWFIRIYTNARIICIYKHIFIYRYIYISKAVYLFYFCAQKYMVIIYRLTYLKRSNHDHIIPKLVNQSETEMKKLKNIVFSHEIEGSNNCPTDIYIYIFPLKFLTE